MKRRVLFVENYAKVEKVIAQDLTNVFDIDERAARIMRLVSGEVSEDLLNVLDYCYSHIALEHQIFMELEN